MIEHADSTKHILYVAKTIAYQIGEELELSWKSGGGYYSNDTNRFTAEIEEEICKKVVALIEDSFPEHSVKTPYNDINKQSDYTWYVDPIDGAKYFIRKIPLFASAVGITYKNKPLAGVIRNPISKQTYWGHEGMNRVFINSDTYVKQKTKPLNSLLIAAELGYFDKLDLEDRITMLNLRSKLNDYVYRVRGFGCLSLTLSWLVTGGLDACITMGGHSNNISLHAGLALLASNNYFYKSYSVLGKEITIAAIDEDTSSTLVEILRKP